jgi:hypothetical protein
VRDDEGPTELNLPFVSTREAQKLGQNMFWKVIFQPKHF